MDREHNPVFQPDPDDRLGIDIDRPATDCMERAEFIDASYR